MAGPIANFTSEPKRSTTAWASRCAAVCRRCPKSWSFAAMRRDSQRRLPAPGFARRRSRARRLQIIAARPGCILQTTVTITLHTTASRRAFSIVEALIAMGLVVLALIGLFGVMPYTYRTLQDDSLRAEASTAA